jgi:predicted nuclease of restriction endonuclease-like (RecB) superfamily
MRERKMAKKKDTKLKPVIKTKMPSEIISRGYKEFLEDLKARIRSAQIKAVISVNQELIKLYWEVGTFVHKRQLEEGWGAKTIEKLSRDLKSDFPDMKGFSPRNIQFMVQFAKEYPDAEIVKQLVSQIPWGHNILLLQRVDNVDARIWYAAKAIEHGWSRNMLEDWTRSDLYRRQGKAITNFQTLLPKPQSDLADQSLKDPYVFDFLTISDATKEKDIEKGLIEHVQKFLVELGKGFAFVGRQVPLRMDDADYYIDLLFFHYKLNCFFVVELKNTAFKPEYAGKMGFYLAAVDTCLKEDAHNRTIGMILCRTKNTLTVEYALKYNVSPIGVSSYEITVLENLPKKLKSSLPTIEEIEAELEVKS